MARKSYTAYRDRGKMSECSQVMYERMKSDTPCKNITSRKRLKTISGSDFRFPVAGGRTGPLRKPTSRIHGHRDNEDKAWREPKTPLLPPPAGNEVQSQERPPLGKGHADTL